MASLRDRPVSWRLLAVSALAITMGLVFGGLRVASAADSAESFGRASQLARLGQQVTVLVQALENERDLTTGIAPISTSKQVAALQSAYAETNTAAASVRTLAAGIDGSFPANIQAKVATVLSDARGLGQLRTIAQGSQSALSVIAAYATPIDAMISLNDQISQGISDAALASDVQTLNTLSLAKDEAAQQRALMYNALLNNNFADGELQALATAQSEQGSDQTAFSTTATPTQRDAFFKNVGGPLVSGAESIETYILDNGAVDVPTVQAIGFNAATLPKTWFADMTGTIDSMQVVERQVAANIVARAQALQRGAESSAVDTALVTVVILLIVAVATLLVTRSLVLPLRRLRADALDIATVQLPERVRRLGESADAAAGLEVVPINVVSGDEIGQVARAFDQVHAEAVRLAGNEALLRSTYNAMFINLSRRSQSLIERLVRLIDSLEQDEDDPGRLSNLFAMDHLVTRMRRNSESLLLLAGRENARKWREPLPLADVGRAAISEIEQYSRVTLEVQQGLSVTGAAVSDVVHLLAEIIENATIFSPKDTLVQMTAQQVSEGGLLIEVIDSGVGIPAEVLAGINERLDNPPVVDVSVSRHMGLFAVGRLAERHGIRIRLRARPPEGIIAMVWLPDAIILQEGDAPFRRRHPALRQIGVLGRRATGAPRSALPADAVPPPVPAGPRGSQRPAAVASTKWFSDPRPSGGGGTSGRPAGPDGGSFFSVAAHDAATPVRDGQTSTGLPLRVPQATSFSAATDDGRQADPAEPGYQADGWEAQAPAQSWPPQRSPDIARGRLSGFQSGVRRGKSQTPRAGEGSDR
ncbi:MAG TPA: nitrate- and nitrite sensing domain-containing protein [Trebonia sp.]|nr:nitrate- and nitrite sensing domain-containing protein [Trebonia sp.]